MVLAHHACAVVVGKVARLTHFAHDLGVYEVKVAKYTVRYFIAVTTVRVVVHHLIRVAERTLLSNKVHKIA